jgi:hypothetical protein
MPYARTEKEVEGHRAFGIYLVGGLFVCYVGQFRDDLITAIVMLIVGVSP